MDIEPAGEPASRSCLTLSCTLPLRQAGSPLAQPPWVADCGCDLYPTPHPCVCHPSSCPAHTACPPTPFHPPHAVAPPRAADGTVPVWHEDVRFFVVKKGGAPKAYFYLDPYSRPAEKRGGAW